MPRARSLLGWLLMLMRLFSLEITGMLKGIFVDKLRHSKIWTPLVLTVRGRTLLVSQFFLLSHARQSYSQPTHTNAPPV